LLDFVEPVWPRRNLVGLNRQSKIRMPAHSGAYREIIRKLRVSRFMAAGASEEIAAELRQRCAGLGPAVFLGDVVAFPTNVRPG
jgi:hypothetical protein